MARDVSRRVTAWCPAWPVTAAGIGPDVPAMVVRDNRVLARSPAAALEGVVIGQRRREAQRRCPDARVLAHDPDSEARAFEPIVAAIGQFAPRLEVIDAGWVCLDARGPSRYFGGDLHLARRLIDAVRAAVSGVGVQVGVADGRFPSAVAARQARTGPLVIPPGQSAAFVAPLPTSWLNRLGELDADTAGLLARMGLHHLGDLAALPAADVLARFGRPGHHAHQLATGTDPRAVHGHDPPLQHQIEHRFDTPIPQLDTLVFVAKHCADQLAARLAAEGQICTRLVVTAETDNHERSERVWYRAAGLRAAAMVDRARWQLSAWTTTGDPTAGIVLLRLHVEETRADHGEQIGLWGGPSAADQRALRAIIRLAGMLGDQAVQVPAWQGGHMPADRYQWTPATTVDLTDPDATAQRLHPPASDQRSGPWPGTVPPPSPVVVLNDPRPAILADTDGQAVQVSGRGELTTTPATLTIGDQPTRTVTGWAGPWPLHEQWWNPHQRRAARLQVLTDDGAAHLAIAEHHQWWITATYA